MFSIPTQRESSECRWWPADNRGGSLQIVGENRNKSLRSHEED
jgi:hypothetical protein